MRLRMVLTVFVLLLETTSLPGIDQETQQGSPFAGMISIKGFGAVSNNIVDDTAALQAAIDVAPSGGVIYPHLVRTRSLAASPLAVNRCG